MGQLLNYDVCVSNVLLYDLNPLPRVFGYLCLGFVGSVITATIQIRHDILIVLDSATILAFSYHWDKGLRFYGSWGTGFQLPVWDEGLPRYGGSSTRFSYQWGKGLPHYGSLYTRFSCPWDYFATVVMIPGSGTSGGELTVTHHALLY